MAQNTYYCPKCGKEMTLFEDTGITTCTECDAKMQIINGELRASFQPNPAFTEERVLMQKQAFKKRILAALLIPVIWVIAGVLMKVFPLDSGGLFLFGNPYALIGSLLAIPVMLYAFGFFEKERSYGEKLGAVAMAMTAFALSLFLLDFIFRLMQDFTYVQTYQVR